MGRKNQSARFPLAPARGRSFRTPAVRKYFFRPLFGALRILAFWGFGAPFKARTARKGGGIDQKCENPKRPNVREKMGRKNRSARFQHVRARGRSFRASGVRKYFFPPPFGALRIWAFWGFGARFKAHTARKGQNCTRKGPILRFREKMHLHAGARPATRSHAPVRAWRAARFRFRPLFAFSDFGISIN